MDESPTTRHRVDDSTAVSIRDMVLDHDGKLDRLIAWQNEIRGAFGLMKLAFGTSLVSALLSMVALLQMLSAPR